MTDLPLPATSLHPGTARGPLLRLTEPLSFWGGSDEHGTIIDTHHSQHGTSLTGAVVLLRSGRGSSSSSSVLAELIRSGAGPAALVLAEPDGILTLGALVAAELYGTRLPIALLPPELHAALPDHGDAEVSCTDDGATLHVPATEPLRRFSAAPVAASDDAGPAVPVAASDDAGPTVPVAASDDARPVAAPADAVGGALRLTAEERDMLEGGHGEGVAFAMRLVVALARTSGASHLLPITSAHVDSCLYHGRASLDVARRFVELGARVAVPTTLNVGSVDLLHPDLVRGEEVDTAAGRELMEAYVQLGGRPTFTCAPYQQLTARPALGEHIAWAESNAIAFINSVVGARTDRYGDFIDVSAAITGRVPAAGFHLDVHRRAGLIVDCSAISTELLAEDAGWGALGLVVGRLVGSGVPALTGVTGPVTDDHLKAFGAGAASSGTVGMFHVVGVTPEAPHLDAVLPDHPIDTVKVTTADLREARDELAPADDRPLDAVSLGTPHFSAAEFAQLAALLTAESRSAGATGSEVVELAGEVGGAGGDGEVGEADADGEADEVGALHPDVEVYVSTSRAVVEEAREHVALCERVGIRIVVDTCTYVTPILGPQVRHAMTDSTKWAWYAPSNLGVTVTLGTMAECVASARAGRVVRDTDAWS